jgi:RecA/RadA recombinase
MTTKFPSPLLGYNNNVRHKGKVFHIQTEDSGVKYGHIITHLFMDGGRILKSVKTGYAEYIGNERMADIVREMMKQQHKAMFIALRDGKFDAIVEGGADASQTTRAIVVDSPPSAAPAPAAAAVPAPPVAAAPVSQAPRAPAPPSAFAPTQALPVTVVPVSSARRPSVAPGAPGAPGALDEDGPPTIRQPESELTLDIDALQRATAAQGGSPGLRQASELPPPPANLFRDRGGLGKYRMTPVPPAAAASSPVAPAPVAPAAPVAQRAPTPPAASKPAAKASPSVPGATPVRKPSQASMPAAGERRYAPTRPAAIFGQTRPQPNKSVFGEDLISDKSLDEVILSYLAEDLDDKKKR